ncbi:hypoxanthine phosphoribosyltransferase [bacterium]|nr:hypoxanthine phosphoribosyltransferase [bacterium]
MPELEAHPLLSEQQVNDKIVELACEIASSFPEGEPVTVIGLLRGCFIFMADLVRELHRKGVIIGEVDFLIASSYGGGTSSSGNVKIERDVKHDIAGKHVLLVDDILDTGATLQKVIELFKSRNPATLKSCVLLEKPARLEVDIKSDFVGFTIPNKFVVGCGLDYDQRYRELPYIGIMKEDD